MQKKTTQKQRIRRHHRIRAKVVGSGVRPRLAVFRSNRIIYAQLIDDDRQATLAAVDTRTIQGTGVRAKAHAAGALIATKAKELGITHVVFDRGGFLYTGTIAEVAEGARAGGLQF